MSTEKIDDRIQVGSFVISTWHPYDKKIVCQVDRIYLRSSGGGTEGVKYCRLSYQYNGEMRTCNVPISYCSLDIKEERNKKLFNLFGW